MDREHLQGYKGVQLLKNHTLGNGSYGAVYKAQCDQLPCAAKVLHPILFDPSALVGGQVPQNEEHRLPIRRFEQECKFLSVIRHPNIVQYIGVCQDKDSGLPVLLMELMDESLTRFLERSSRIPIPFHTEANICYDIALALSFLHSNDIVHRDLSSNNVLMLGDRRAKVTDFGMARLFDHVACSLTKLPGTEVYMPPECMKDKPQYTSKLDVFILGVLVIQILCKKFPEPSERLREVRAGGEVLYQKIPEIDRRRNHINLVTPDNPLLAVALNCIRDLETDRPSAQDVAERLGTFMTSSRYVESRRNFEDQLNIAQTRESDNEMVSQLLQNIEIKDGVILETHNLLLQKNQELQELQRRMEDLMAEKDDQITRCRERMDILERMLQDSSPVAKEITMASLQNGRAPRAMHRMSNAVLNGDVIYFCTHRLLYALNLQAGEWSQLPRIDEHKEWSVNTIAVVQGNLTTVGGCDEDENVTDRLFSFIRQEGQWKEVLPRMKTKRDSPIAFTYSFYLVVAGGVMEDNSHLQTVEVLNTSTMQWSEAEPLPEPLSLASVTISNGNVYFLGGWFSDKTPTSSVQTCRFTDLINSSLSVGGGRVRSKLWSRIADLPVLKSTAIDYHGHLIAVGGVDVMNRATTAVYCYDAAFNSWVVIGHLLVPRGQPFVTMLPTYNVVLVVGGHKGYYINKIYEIEEVTIHIRSNF